ncbi:hypothetical protein [Sphingomonas aerolata]|uniref:hypothetical protein n=1 Tax=Sphingomonas aerolata TaxID=185951 RepID=UPI002FE24429
MDGETALLASLPPSAWNETLRRLQVVRSFRNLAAPNGADIRDHADAYSTTCSGRIEDDHASVQEARAGKPDGSRIPDRPAGG